MLSPFALKYFPVIPSSNEDINLDVDNLDVDEMRKNNFINCLKAIIEMPYYKNGAAISGAVHNIACHEDALSLELQKHGLKKTKIPNENKRDEILKFNENPELACCLPSGSFVEQPCGTHNSPDFIVKVSDKLVVFIEAKSSKSTFPLYNSGGVKQDYLYVFCSEKTNKTTIYKGSSIINNEQQRLIDEHIEKCRKADEELNLKLKEHDTNHRGICYYTRPMINQAGGKSFTDYFDHKNKKQCEIEALNWIKNK